MWKFVAVQSKKAVTAHFSSEQLLPFLLCRCDHLALRGIGVAGVVMRGFHGDRLGVIPVLGGRPPLVPVVLKG